MIPAFLNKSQIPHRPGVYLFKNNKGKTIYVGKAIDLYHRVLSYFSTSEPSTWKVSSNLRTRHMESVNHKMTAFTDEIVSVETIIVESELEALILEANLIKKYLPKFNIRLADSKDYLYIKIIKENFPRVATARKHDLNGSLKYFGPFPSSRTVRDTLKALRRVFPWCSQPPRQCLARLRPCFYYHLSLCPGPCAGQITKQVYRKNIFRLAKLLEGKKDQLVDELSKEMNAASKNQKFEEAGRLKRIVDGINYLTQSNKVESYLENPNFLEDQKQVTLEGLKAVLNLKTIPQRIEGYDISNIGGKEATGSMVVLTNGDIDKSQYRKFKIRITGRPNDVAMMREVIRRRLNHPEWPTPDLIIVDGGKGQVGGVVRTVREVGSSNFQSIPVIGLAKRMEWLYSVNGQIIKLPRSSPALHLLQKLRDEAHRFAVSYHRSLRRKIGFFALIC